MKKFDEKFHHQSKRKFHRAPKDFATRRDERKFFRGECNFGGFEILRNFGELKIRKNSKISKKSKKNGKTLKRKILKNFQRKILKNFKRKILEKFKMKILKRKFLENFQEKILKNFLNVFDLEFFLKFFF